MILIIIFTHCFKNSCASGAAEGTSFHYPWETNMKVAVNKDAMFTATSQVTKMDKMRKKRIKLQI